MDEDDLVPPEHMEWYTMYRITSIFDSSLTLILGLEQDNQALVKQQFAEPSVTKRLTFTPELSSFADYVNAANTAIEHDPSRGEAMELLATAYTERVIGALPSMISGWNSYASVHGHPRIEELTDGQLSAVNNTYTLALIPALLGAIRMGQDNPLAFSESAFTEPSSEDMINEFRSLLERLQGESE